jgi:hypothetical protein
MAITTINSINVNARQFLIERRFPFLNHRFRLHSTFIVLADGKADTIPGSRFGGDMPPANLLVKTECVRCRVANKSGILRAGKSGKFLLEMRELERR